MAVPGLDDVWRWFTAPFVHGDALGYQFVTLIAVGIFGSLLERRFGPVPVVAVFVLAGAAGSALVVALEVPALLSDFPSRSSRAPTAQPSACSAPGSWTTAWPRGAATIARTT